MEGTISFCAMILSGNANDVFYLLYDVPFGLHAIDSF